EHSGCAGGRAAALPVACREWPCGATGALHRIPPAHPYLSNLLFLGSLAFFAESLEVSGLFARWVNACPMAYTSPNAPAVVDVLGTWLLSILDGQRRYAHVAGLRGDEVAPRILGMNKLVSDESLRRALAHLAPNQAKRCSDEERAAHMAQMAKSTAWMDASLDENSREALRPLNPRDRHHHQAAVRPPEWRRNRLQPHQAGSAKPYPAYLLDRQHPHGA
ncbi:MAG: hypothetical protein Q8P40_03590, partial [Nitrospirota bacterium]|nr:hypothetical protein [Nitrospirota bacterium]